MSGPSKRSRGAKASRSRPRKNMTGPATRVNRPNLDKLIGYVRVSTAEQATNGISLEAQESRLLAYAAGPNFECPIVSSNQ